MTSPIVQAVVQSLFTSKPQDEGFKEFYVAAGVVDDPAFEGRGELILAMGISKEAVFNVNRWDREIVQACKAQGVVFHTVSRKDGALIMEQRRVPGDVAFKDILGLQLSAPGGVV